MATAHKPAKARKTTKARARKPATKKVEIEIKDDPNALQAAQGQIDYNSPQWAAKVQAYATLKNAESAVPDEIAIPVEAWLASERAKAEVELATLQSEADAIREQDESGRKWVRNLLTSPFNIRLERQDKKRRIELKPRGVRGDMFPLEPGDENDHNLLACLATPGTPGYVEIIGDGSARKVAEGQTHNIQKTNTTLAMLRNPLGEPIEKLEVTTEYNKQGVTVAYIDPAQQEKLEKGELSRSKAPLADLTRQQPEQVAHWVPTGGNPAIVSQGFSPQGVPQMTDTANLAVADKLARVKGRQGRPEDVLALQVTVDPTRQS
jgi:hypothetical protein